jgi:hypothetical protein
VLFSGGGKISSQRRFLSQKYYSFNATLSKVHFCITFFFCMFVVAMLLLFLLWIEIEWCWCEDVKRRIQARCRFLRIRDDLVWGKRLFILFFVCDVIQSWLLWEPRRGQYMENRWVVMCVCLCLCVYIYFIYLFSTAMGWLGVFLGIFNFIVSKCEQK